MPSKLLAAPLAMVTLRKERIGCSRLVSRRGARQWSTWSGAPTALDAKMCSKVVGTHARTGQVVVSGSEQLPKTLRHALVTGARDYGEGRTAYSQDLADR
jgi:hypothetical protein